MRSTVGNEENFVEYLESLVETKNRAALAALRRGLGKPPGTVTEMHPIVVPMLPKNASAEDEEVFYLIAALFSLHQMNWHPAAEEKGRTNFGASFARLRTSLGGERSGSIKSSIESRFVALLNSHRDDLPEHLRHAVALLRSHDLPVDWAGLMRDIRDWDRDDRRVQRVWSRAFWQSVAQTEGGHTAGGVSNKERVGSDPSQKPDG
jgi:CRISPR system Cascade subunit CasB